MWNWTRDNQNRAKMAESGVTRPNEYEPAEVKSVDHFCTLTRAAMLPIVKTIPVQNERSADKMMKLAV